MYIGSIAIAYIEYQLIKSKSEQVTGILGVKAYLCLDRSRVVGAVLAVIQVIWLTLTVVDVFDIRAERSLSGGDLYLCPWHLMVRIKCRPM